MTTLNDICAGLATRLKTVSGLNVYERVFSNVTPPAAVIFGPAWGPAESMQRGTYELEIKVRLLVASVNDTEAQRRLYDYIDVEGSKSIPRAVDGDDTLGDIVAATWFEGSDPPSMFEHPPGAAAYLGVDMTFAVTR